VKPRPKAFIEIAPNFDYNLLLKQHNRASGQCDNIFQYVS